MILFQKTNHVIQANLFFISHNLSLSYSAETPEDTLLESYTTLVNTGISSNKGNGMVL